MIDRKISVHLQDFPSVSFLSEEKDLVTSMDLVRAICSATLSIRDNKNLRVRLPLAKLIIIGRDAKKILSFADIIKEEVNVKSLEIKEEIGDLAELKLQINFKKIGAKYGTKVKEITEAAKKNDWKKVSEKEISIAGINLIDDEFELKLVSKNQDDKKFVFAALPNNSGQIQLDIEITKELENEGIARDIVRAIQQNRKDANLDITNRIKIKIFSKNSRILEVAKDFENYIKEQVLGDELIVAENEAQIKSASKISFENKLDDGDLVVGIN